MTIGRLEIPKELEERFDGMAHIKGVKKDDLILMALEEWIEDLEDTAQADEVMAGIKAGTVKVYSAKEVWERLGLGD